MLRARWVRMGLRNPLNPSLIHCVQPGGLSGWIAVGGITVDVGNVLVPCRASFFCPLVRGLVADAFWEDRTALQLFSTCWVTLAVPVGTPTSVIGSSGFGGGSPTGFGGFGGGTVGVELVGELGLVLDVLA